MLKSFLKIKSCDENDSGRITEKPIENKKKKKDVSAEMIFLFAGKQYNPKIILFISSMQASRSPYQTFWHW